jgi:hypothetical protein
LAVLEVGVVSEDTVGATGTSSGTSCHTDAGLPSFVAADFVDCHWGGVALALGFELAECLITGQRVGEDGSAVSCNADKNREHEFDIYVEGGERKCRGSITC